MQNLRAKNSSENWLNANLSWKLPTIFVRLDFPKSVQISSITQIYTHLRKSERVWVSRFAFWRKWKSERLDLRFERKWKCEHLWGIWTARFQWWFPPQSSWEEEKYFRIRVYLCFHGFQSPPPPKNHRLGWVNFSGRTTLLPLCIHSWLEIT